VLLDGEAGGGTKRGDLELAVDRGQVVVDGAEADDQLFGDLDVGQSSHQQRSVSTSRTSAQQVKWWWRLRKNRWSSGWDRLRPGRLFL